MLRFKTVNIICIVFLVVLILVNQYYSWSIYYYIILFFSWFLLTLAGSTLIQWNYHFTSINSNKTIKKNQVSITFDDGPNPEFTPKILDLLKQYNAKATFFCIGKNIETYPELLKSIIEQGHTIGNHTYSHATNFGFFKTEKVIEEIQQTNAIVKTITGLTLKLYRPTFGVTNPRIKKALIATGLQSIGWNKRSLDTTFRSSKTIIKRITKNLKKGDIILMHDTSLKTVAVLEQLLLFLQQQKLESVTVDSLCNIKAYA